MLVSSGAEVRERAPEAALAVLGENLADGCALDVVRALRAGSAGAGLPVFLVSDAYTDAAEVAALEAGGDEFIDANQMGPRLLRRLRARLQRAWERREENPLTGLPGRGRLDRELALRLRCRTQLALVSLDLRNFKAFNDHYGYERGDRLLRLVRDLLLEVLRESGQPADLALHLGGDDFFLLTQPRRAETLCRRLREKFDQRAPELYDIKDRTAGGFRAFSRGGERVFIPLTHLTMVGVTQTGTDLRQAGQLAQVLAELKDSARASENEELIWDRRLLS